MSEAWLQQLQINDLFDIHDSAYRTRLIGKVIEIKETKIRVHFCGWRTKKDFLDSTKIAPLHTNTFPVEWCQFNYDHFANHLL